MTLARLDSTPGSCFETMSLSLLAPCGFITYEMSAASSAGTAATIAF